MIQVFDSAPAGLQPAPKDPRMLAAGYQVSVREVNFGTVTDRESLMLAFLGGLALTQSFGRNWDALYDVLTDPETRPARFALLLCGYARFRSRHATLATPLEATLIDAQAEATRLGRQLWLLIEEADSDPDAW